jgi:hypothetical protein
LLIAYPVQKGIADGGYDDLCLTDAELAQGLRIADIPVRHLDVMLPDLGVFLDVEIDDQYPLEQFGTGSGQMTHDGLRVDEVPQHYDIPAWIRQGISPASFTMHRRLRGKSRHTLDEHGNTVVVVYGECGQHDRNHQCIGDDYLVLDANHAIGDTQRNDQQTELADLRQVDRHHQCGDGTLPRPQQQGYIQQQTCHDDHDYQRQCLQQDHECRCRQGNAQRHEEQRHEEVPQAGYFRQHFPVLGETCQRQSRHQCTHLGRQADAGKAFRAEETPAQGNQRQQVRRTRHHHHGPGQQEAAEQHDDRCEHDTATQHQPETGASANALRVHIGQRAHGPDILDNQGQHRDLAGL